MQTNESPSRKRGRGDDESDDGSSGSKRQQTTNNGDRNHSEGRSEVNQSTETDVVDRPLADEAAMARSATLSDNLPEHLSPNALILLHREQQKVLDAAQIRGVCGALKINNGILVIDEKMAQEIDIYLTLVSKLTNWPQCDTKPIADKIRLELSKTSNNDYEGPDRMIKAYHNFCKKKVIDPIDKILHNSGDVLKSAGRKKICEKLAILHGLTIFDAKVGYRWPPKLSHLRQELEQEPGKSGCQALIDVYLRAERVRELVDVLDEAILASKEHGNFKADSEDDSDD